MLERFRLRFTFWLDLNKDDEREIAETIDDLKQKRSFAKTIRDGIRLITDLSRGKTDVLFELFPWVFDHVYALAEADLQGGGGREVTNPDNYIQTQLKRLEQLILEQGSLPVVQKPSKAPIPLEESFEDEDLELEVREASHNENNRSDWNFMIASAMQVQGHCGGLPDEIIRYGLHTKRISLKDVPRWEKQVPKVPCKDRPRSKGGPKAMMVPQFAPPDFDNVDLPEIALRE